MLSPWSGHPVSFHAEEIGTPGSRLIARTAAFTNSEEKWIPYLWYSDYSDGHGETTEAIDQAWDNIVAAHGIVALDHQWAAERALPPSHSLPSDHSKGVYILDAYHQIHCLVDMTLPKMIFWILIVIHTDHYTQDFPPADERRKPDLRTWALYALL